MLLGRKTLVFSTISTSNEKLYKYSKDKITSKLRHDFFAPDARFVSVKLFFKNISKSKANSEVEEPINPKYYENGHQKIYGFICL